MVKLKTKSKNTNNVNKIKSKKQSIVVKKKKINLIRDDKNVKQKKQQRQQQKSSLKYNKYRRRRRTSNKNNTSVKSSVKKSYKKRQKLNSIKQNNRKNSIKKKTTKRQKSRRKSKDLENFGNGKTVTSQMRTDALSFLYHNLIDIIHQQIKSKKYPNIIKAFPKRIQLCETLKCLEKKIFHRYGMYNPHQYITRCINITQWIQYYNDGSILIDNISKLIDSNLEQELLRIVIKKEILKKVESKSTIDIDKLVQQILCISGAYGLMCVKCGEKNVTVSLQQIRSADEGMTIFCKCNNEECGFCERID